MKPSLLTGVVRSRPTRMELYGWIILIMVAVNLQVVSSALRDVMSVVVCLVPLTLATLGVFLECAQSFRRYAMENKENNETEGN